MSYFVNLVIRLFVESLNRKIKSYFLNGSVLPQMEVESFYGENGFFIGLKKRL